MLDEALLKAYNETEYRLLLEPVIVLVPGQTSSAADGLYCTNRVKDVLPLSPDALSLQVP